MIVLSTSLLPAGLSQSLHIRDELSLANDNNFFALLILFGLVVLNFRSSSYKVYPEVPQFIRITINLLFIFTVIMSGSRRGLASLVILIVVYFVNSITTRLSDPEPGVFLKKLKTTAYSIVGLLLISFAIIYSLPEEKLKELSYRYMSIAGISEKDYIDRMLWDADPKSFNHSDILIEEKEFSMASGYWMSNSHETKLSDVQTLFGNGIRLQELSKETSFSLYYNGPKFLFYANHTYQISFKIKFITGDFNSFRIGWWVDDGSRGYLNTSNLAKKIDTLSGGWYSCTSLYTFIDNHAGISGYINSVTEGSEFIITGFQLKDLSINQNLPKYVAEVKNIKDIVSHLAQLNYPFDENKNLINNGNFHHGINFWNCNSDSVNLIPASVDGRKCLLISKGDGQEGNWSLFYTGRNIQFIKDNEYVISFKVKPVVPKTIVFSTGFWLDEGNGYLNALKTDIDTLVDGWLEMKTSVTFKDNHNDLIFPINSQAKNSIFYITDIVLQNNSQVQNQIVTGHALAASSSVYADRTERWRYAKYLWDKEYRWYNKIFGHGFDYLNWYGNKFNNGNPDWPHNPFISVFLYSGIIGFLFYLWLLVKAVIIYYKHKEKYGAAFLCFLLTLFFSFFSASSPFDPPIMGFFIILPFFINSIHKNDKGTTNDENSNNR
jgi:hypothetical protein